MPPDKWSAPRKGKPVPPYLIQAAYSPQAWSALTKSPHDRMEVVRPIVERLGGRIISAYLAFGEYDVIIIAELPDNISAAAFSAAASAGGGIKEIRTTPLITIEEGLAVMQKAGELGSEPPQQITPDIRDPGAH